MTETTSAPTETTESVEEFASRARTWLAENMPPIDPANPPEHDRGEEATVATRPRVAEEAL